MGKKILIVDDEPDVLKVAALRLKGLGYDAITAADGTTALKLIKEAGPDLILLDLRLPDISGLEVCKRIKSDDRLKDIPVMLITASAQNVAEKVKESGAQGYILKPFEPEALSKKLKEFI